MQQHIDFPMEISVLKFLSCIICNFWYFYFKNNVSIFQEHIKNTKIQVYFLPFL